MPTRLQLLVVTIFIEFKVVCLLWQCSAFFITVLYLSDALSFSSAPKRNHCLLGCFSFIKIKQLEQCSPL